MDGVPPHGAIACGLLGHSSPTGAAPFTPSVKGAGLDHTSPKSLRYLCGSSAVTLSLPHLIPAYTAFASRNFPITYAFSSAEFQSGYFSVTSIV